MVIVKINASKYRTNEIFKFIRQGLDVTQEEMSKKVGISKSSIEKYEYGTVNYTFETLVKIAKKYDIDIEIKIK